MRKNSDLVPAASLSLHLTSTGYVALACPDMEATTNHYWFGSRGLRPPQRLSELVETLLKDMSAAPDKTDAAELRSLASDLKSSLESVETMLARLEN
jgi:hypothetical protein